MTEPRRYPALDVVWPSAPADDTLGLVLADLDNFDPTAVEDLPNGIRVFFTRVDDRDRAAIALQTSCPEAALTTSSVSDEAWAERSQASIGAIRVGRIVITPPWLAGAPHSPADIVVTIQPSMGFGTGHHASTRLCLRLLQDLAVDGCSMLDVGTGSGVLAIVGWRLGAAPVTAVDVDDDALTSATENIENAGASVTLRNADIMQTTGELAASFDLVTANLTGALLERAGAALNRLVATNGVLIASGFQDDEASTVLASLGSHGFVLDGRAGEDGWVSLRLRRSEKLEARS